ncbi:hypothetical protein NDA14_004707 [Ustilago hordei]|nr:hypothetical protein NDA14_006128 [Ustilago hordei]KAJ1603869.1 hypothetical protein NDA14_004707 [Ustilago hordei]UTT88333.1 hypothetical protein NDA17_003985 [Ustilago hordei]
MEAFKASVVTISDTSLAHPSLDGSGAILVDQLSIIGLTCISRHYVGDQVCKIRSTVQLLFELEGVDLVVTTGGTGFGVRDVTPEALEPLISRKTPALTHAITAYSLNKTPLAALSRSVTGICKANGREGLLVALPGSPKAVKECLEVLLGNGLLLHALQLLSGASGEARHREMQGDRHRNANVHTTTHTTCSHHHHEGGEGIHSHQAPKQRTTPADDSGFRTIHPTGGASLRHRTSPYPLLQLDQALRLIAEHTPKAEAIVTMPVSTALIGHVLAQDVPAMTDIPPRPTTNVDGYALNSATTPPGHYRVATLKSLHSLSRCLQQDEIFRINTGQGLPQGTDAVVMVEDTELIHAVDGEELTVQVLAKVEPGENVRQRGSDVKVGQVVLGKGTTISALGGEIGTLAFLGRSSVSVYRKPKVAILSTGNELQDGSAQNWQMQKGEPWGFTLFDANRPGLHAAITGLGFQVIDLGIVGDDISTTLTALRRGMEEADLVLTTGGTSMGESDLLKPLIERELQGKIHFGRVAMKPGKPTTFATIKRAKQTKVIFALPGNPASALVTFYILVLPSLRKLAGYPAHSSPSSQRANPWSLASIPVTLACEMRLDPRPEFHRVILRSESSQGLVAYSTGNQRSSAMHSMASANALIALPPLQNGEMKSTLQAGEKASAILLGSLV